MNTPIYFFRVNVADNFAIYDGLLPDENPENILYQINNQTVWVQEVNRELKQGDAFTLSGERAVRVKDLYIDKWPKVLELFDIPDVQGLAVASNDPETMTVSWTPNDTYRVVIDYNSTFKILPPGTSSVSFNCPPGTYTVRLRFTDGQKNYSRRYAVASQIVEQIEENECFPYVELMDGSDLTAELLGTATYNPGDEYVQLTPNASGQSGQLSILNNCTLPSYWEAEFDFKHIGGADATYFYFNCKDIPINESGIYSVNEEDQEFKTEGYIIGFSEYGESLTLTYASDDYEEIGDNETYFYLPYEYNEDQWYTAKITYYEGKIWIYIDDELLMVETPQHVVANPDYIYCGIGARSGGINGEHRVRRLSVTIPEALPAIPDVEGFSLFSWGKSVYAAWEPNSFYETQIDTQIDEEWSPVQEEFFANRIGDY